MSRPDPATAAAAADDRHLTPQGVERKQQLLEHAARLFAERGYAETRIADIVKAAGVAKGLFYWYFENKEALFLELVQTTRHHMRQQQTAAIDPAANPLVRVRQGVEASIVFMGEQRRLYSMFDLETVDSDLREMLRRGSDVHALDTARHIRAGIDAGLVRDDDPLMLAWGVVGTVSSYSHLHRTGRLDWPLDEVARFTGRFVVRALASSDAVALDAEREDRDRFLRARA
ncbi:MAG TPA: helix-turn-helix domain-containing protein [Acidimicrobiales bacterium]|nr:helix-turn-helix domain-containing protein [Acidimicrobiales bacterium]